MNEIAPRYTFLGNSFDRDIQYFTDDSRVSYKQNRLVLLIQFLKKNKKKLQKMCKQFIKVLLYGFNAVLLVS